jgi:hypothetical protein
MTSFFNKPEKRKKKSIVRRRTMLSPEIFFNVARVS